jgi:dUTP pyrophosphatase
VNEFKLKEILVYKLDPKAKTPTRVNSTDTGLDLYALEDVFIAETYTRAIKTGVAIRIPEGFSGKIETRSSYAQRGLSVLGGVIDALYSGDITVVLHNINNRADISPTDPLFTRGHKVKAGDKIAQLIITPVETPKIVVVNELWTSARGSKGFGSSGKI